MSAGNNPSAAEVGEGMKSSECIRETRAEASKPENEHARLVAAAQPIIESWGDPNTAAVGRLRTFSREAGDQLIATMRGFGYAAAFEMNEDWVVLFALDPNLFGP